MKNDYEVYKQIVEDKCKGYRKIIIVLVTLLTIFVIATMVLCILYFNSGSVVKETEVTVLTNGGNIKNAIVASDNSNIIAESCVSQNSNTSGIYAIVIMAGLVIFGGVLCLWLCMKK